MHRVFQCDYCEETPMNNLEFYWGKSFQYNYNKCDISEVYRLSRLNAEQIAHAFKEM